MNKILASFLVLLFICAPLPLVAQELSSSSFRVTTSIINDSGGLATSTSYEQVGVIGGTAFGESTSSNFILQSGPLYFNSYTPQTLNWRWYGDETNETPTSALAAENTAPTGVDNQDAVKLRVTVQEAAGIASSSVKFKLQFSTSADFSGTVVDVVSTGSCAATSRWCYYDGAGTDNGVITTGTLSDADSCTGSSGNGCGTHNEDSASGSSFNHVANAATEFEFTIQNKCIQNLLIDVIQL